MHYPPVSNEPGLAQSCSLKSWLFEIGPLVWVMAFLWCKLIYFSLSLRSLWWAPKESIQLWIGSHPHVFSATLASLILLLAPIPLFRRSWRFVILLLLNVFVTTLVVVDTVHVRFYGDVISVVRVTDIVQLKGLSSSILRRMHQADLLFYVDIVIGIVVLPFYLRASARIRRVDPIHMRRLSAGLVVSGVLIAMPTARLALEDRNGTFAYSSLQRDVCSVIGLLPYHVSDVVIHVASLRRGIGEAERRHVRRFLDDRVQKRGTRSDMFGIAQGLNVIVIMAESLQGFPIGLEVEGQLVAPRLSRFRRESLYFANFYDQTHLGTTADGEFTSMQSLYPLPVGVVAKLYKKNHYRGLPAILSEHGYVTLSATGEPGYFWNMKEMHPRLGFQHSFFEDSYRIQERIGPWMADREFFTQTIPILQAQAEPFLAYLISSSNHHPFKLPKKLQVLRLGELEGTLLGDYLQSVHYFDQAFGEFVDKLRETGLLDRSMVVVYGDHQAFLNASELAYALGFPERSEYHHFQVRKKVPFFIRLPRGKGAGVRRVTGGHLDIAPTLLSLLGITDEHSVMLGEDLTGVNSALVVFRDGSFADGKHYFINHFGLASASTCYGAETGQTLDCGLLEGQHREAVERLELSDLIIRGDLIPEMTAAAKKTASSQ